MNQHESRIHAMLKSTPQEWGNLNTEDFEAIRWLHRYAIDLREEKDDAWRQLNRIAKAQGEGKELLKLRVAELTQIIANM